MARGHANEMPLFGRKKKEDERVNVLADEYEHDIENNATDEEFDMCGWYTAGKYMKKLADGVNPAFKQNNTITV